MYEYKIRNRTSKKKEDFFTLVRAKTFWCSANAMFIYEMYV